MKTLGNIIWVIFGKMHFRLAKLALSPFGNGSFTFWERGCIAREQERET